MSDAKHTPGFCHIGQWNEKTREAQLLMGCDEPGSDLGWVYGEWVRFRSEADAREFVRRWNALPRLLAACEVAMEHLDYEHVPDDVYFAVRDAVVETKDGGE